MTKKQAKKIPKSDIEMIIDTGASKSIISSSSLEKLVTNCSDKEKQWIMQNREFSNNSFKFGSGTSVKSSKVLHMPVLWKNISMTLNLNVIDQDVPFLLGMEALTKLGLKLNLDENKLEMRRQKRPIERNSVRHIVCKSIVVDKEKVGKEMQKIFHMADESDVEKMLKKVHNSLDHASAVKMKLMMQNTTLWKKVGQSNMMKKINDLMANCKPCKEIERPSDKRKNTNNARSERFNGKIAIDLSEWYDQKSQKKRIICHIIDEFSRVSSAQFVEDNTPEEVLRALFACWVSKYGIPEQIIHDLGGEFTGEKWLMMMNMLQIRDRTTAGYSPFSNGIVE